MENSIKTILQDQQTSNLRFVSFNHLQPENALKIVTNNFINNLSEDDTSINTSACEIIIHNLLQATLSQLEKYNPYTDPRCSALRQEIFSMLEEYLSITINTNAKKIANSSTLHNSQDFLGVFLSQISNDSEKIAITQSLIGIFGYFQDSKKIMNQKGKIIDMEDYEHSKFIPYCKYFVTNDKHLSKRLKASIHALKIQTRVLNLNDFLREINNLKPDFQSMLNINSHFQNHVPKMHVN